MDLKIVLGGSIHTNCYILYENSSALLIDYAPEVLDFLRDRQLNPTALMLTHIHFDHFEGLSDFLAMYPDIAVYISKEGKNGINNPVYTLNFQGDSHINTDSFIAVDNASIIEWVETKIKVLKTPGHSVDSVVYYVPELKSIFCGDTIFYRSIGRTDFPGSSHELLMDSIATIFAQYDDETILYPGHGPKTTIGSEKKHNSFIRSFV